jgi:hypothetical protein
VRRSGSFEFRDCDDTGAFWSLVLSMWVAGLIAISTLMAVAVRNAEREEQRAPVIERIAHQ